MAEITDAVAAAEAARVARLGESAVAEFTTTGATEEPKAFKVDGDVYLCAPAMPADLMTKIGVLTEATGLDRIKVVAEFLDAVLLPESQRRYAARMRSAERPIRIEEAAEHVMHLIREVYGVTRPSVPSSSSPAG